MDRIPVLGGFCDYLANGSTCSQTCLQKGKWKNMEINIAVIPGDGIGPEITEATEQVLKRVCEIYGHVLNITHVKACSSSIEETGEPLPKESLKKCLQADAVLLGNTGLEKYKNER